MHNLASISPQRIRRPAVAVLAVLAVAVLASSCTRPVAGAPITSDEGVRRAMEQRFDAIIDKIDTYLANDKSAKAIESWEAAINDQSGKNTTTRIYYGDPPTTLIKRGSVSKGNNLDIFHPAGSKYDYVLLGERLSSLAPTTWVAKPNAVYHSGLKDTCVLPSKKELCKITSAIEQTAKNPSRNISKVAYTNEDGSVSLLTNMTVKQFIDSGIIIYPEEDVAALPPSILESLLSARIDVTANNEVRRAMIKGSISRGSKKFSLNMTHEIVADAKGSDFPPTPSRSEVTVINDQNRAEKFIDKAIDLYTELRDK